MAPRKKARISELIAPRHVSLVECFGGGQGPQILWDASTRWKLVWPGLRATQQLVWYIGREKAQELYGDVLRLSTGNVMQILGAKGCGKSTVMAAIAAYLHGSGTKRVVYLSGFHFVAAPFPVLLEALLLAWWGEEEEREELWGISDMKGLQDWCCWKDALIIVDDWDKVELNETLKADLALVCEGNMVIRISSVNSRERQAYDTSDKADDYIFTFTFDGPFTESELDTWIAHSDLPPERLRFLDYFTGGMPRLSRIYSEAADDGAYMETISPTVSSRVETEIVAHLTNKERVVAALRMVTRSDGLPLQRSLGMMKLSCFYKVGNRYRILCPYLKTLAEEAIVSKGTLLESKLRLDDVQTWIAAVRADMRIAAGSRNPARIGWNVEGLFIGVLRVQGQLLAGFPFARYLTYSRGKEMEALDTLDDEALRGGVLMGPEAFNEKAVDIVYLILRMGRIELIGVQVTVAQWKAREKKRSHETWGKEVLPQWIAEISHPVDESFWYAMPEGVKLEDVDKVQVKAFSDFCPRLAFLNALALQEPKAVQKGMPVTCRDKVTRCARRDQNN